MSNFQPEDDPRWVNRRTMRAGILLLLGICVVAWSAWKIHWHGESAARMNKPPATATAPAPTSR